MSRGAWDGPGHVARPCLYPATRWTLIAAVKESGSPAARKALAELCQAYWYPLYAFIRRSGHDRDQAEDLTQAFFASLLEKEAFASADPVRGRFRSFLLASCKHFLANQHDRAAAQKRGGGRPILALDDAEGRYRHETSRALSAEQPLPRPTLEGSRTRSNRCSPDCRRVRDQPGKTHLFSELKGYLTGDAGRPQAVAATELGISEGAVKVAAHRMRRRYRELLLRRNRPNSWQSRGSGRRDRAAIFAALALPEVQIDIFLVVNGSSVSLDPFFAGRLRPKRTLC